MIALLPQVRQILRDLETEKLVCRDERVTEKARKVGRMVDEDAELKLLMERRAGADSKRKRQRRDEFGFVLERAEDEDGANIMFLVDIDQFDDEE